MNRRLAVAAAVVLVVLAAAYWFMLRERTVEARIQAPNLAAAIGEGDDAVGVSGNGSLVRWLPLPEDPPLPQLPLEEPPKGGRIQGPALEQVRVLAATPTSLRPYVAGSSYGDNGVEVELTTGIELRFGDAGRAVRKWRAAAAVLADPSVTALDYVDLQAPNRPTFGGSSYELPPAP